jgi:hypothetical protein
MVIRNSRTTVAVSALCVTGMVAAVAATAASAGVCDPIIEAGNQNQAAFQAFTEQAYSDGQITPEEAQQTEDYSRRQAQITADLATCIQTGVVPPGYPPAGSVSIPGKPVTNHFNVELAKWRIGDKALTLNWETSEPTQVWVGFYDGKKLVGSLNAPMGADSVDFKGKLGTDKSPKAGKLGGRIKPGNYTLKLVATDTDGEKSKPQKAKLKVLPKH